MMPVESVLAISGRGTVVTGRITRGTVKIGDNLELVGLKSQHSTTCTGVETFKKNLVMPPPQYFKCCPSSTASFLSVSL